MQFSSGRGALRSGQRARSEVRTREKGAVQVEFALAALTLFLVIFGIVETGADDAGVHHAG